MTCIFCHNEGTPVTSDNLKSNNGKWIKHGRSGRTSIYVENNKVTFLPAMIMPDEDFRVNLQKLQKVFQFKEVHLTGGEPTLHPYLSDLVKMIKSLGLSVAMTSNGENGMKCIPSASKEGLEKINFSVFGTTGEELLMVQNTACRDSDWGEKKIDSLKKSIACAIENKVKVSTNIVIVDQTHINRIHNLLNNYPPEISVRIMRSLENRQEATKAIKELFEKLGAKLVSHQITAGVSDERHEYELENGRRVWFKQLRHVRLPETCKDCIYNNEEDCHEGFYGIRMYKDHIGGYQIGVCIQRMDFCQPLDQFIESNQAKEIVNFQKSEYDRIKMEYKGREVHCPLNLKPKLLK
ncbi:radical SAM protein [Shimazuella sp. AN120528]|nr:radical SAM protein [Shimazuella soli]MCH5585793.1 radical SAM protein [Shimazuella soli]